MSEISKLEANNWNKIRKIILSKGEIPAKLFGLKDNSLKDYYLSGHGHEISVYHKNINDPDSNLRLNICSFVLDDIGNVIYIDYIYDNDLFLNVLSILEKSPFFNNFIKKNYGDQLKNLNTITVEEKYDQIKKYLKFKIENEKIVYKIRTSFLLNFKGRKKLDVDDGKVLSVGQSEIGELDHHDQRRYIETVGAGPCIILIGYNRTNKKVLLSHIDITCDPQKTLYLIKNCLGSGELEFHVLGADESNIKNLIEVNDWFQKNKITPKTFDVLNGEKSIIFDKENGELFDVLIGRDRHKNVRSLILRTRVPRNSINGGLLPISVK